MSELEQVGNHHRKVVAGLEREIAQLVHDRNEWMVKAGKATALASQYLRERDALREVVAMTKQRARDWREQARENGKRARQYQEALEESLSAGMVSFLTLFQEATWSYDENRKSLDSIQRVLQAILDARDALTREE